MAERYNRGSLNLSAYNSIFIKACNNNNTLRLINSTVQIENAGNDQNVRQRKTFSTASIIKDDGV